MSDKWYVIPLNEDGTVKDNLDAVVIEYDELWIALQVQASLISNSEECALLPGWMWQFVQHRLDHAKDILAIMSECDLAISQLDSAPMRLRRIHDYAARLWNALVPLLNAENRSDPS